MVMVIPADYPLMYQVVVIIYALGFPVVFVHLHLIPTKFSLNIRAVVVISYLKTLLQHQLNEDVDSDGHYDFHDAQSILVFLIHLQYEWHLFLMSLTPHSILMVEYYDFPLYLKS